MHTVSVSVYETFILKAKPQCPWIGCDGVTLLFKEYLELFVFRNCKTLYIMLSTKHYIKIPCVHYDYIR